MKRIFSGLMAFMLVCGVAGAQSIKLVNTFGGDSDSTGSSDLFVFQNQKDDEGKYKNEFGNETRVSNRLQLDASDKKFDSRLRMEIGTTKLNGKESSIRFRGYGRFKPVEQFQLIAGNDFFTKVAVGPGYLVASDDTPKYARILQNGFGAISSWTLGDDKNADLSIAGGLKGVDNSFLEKDTLGLDAGFNFRMRDLFSMGASFQNMAGDNRSIGIFAGLEAVENLTLNAGYIYNATDTDFIAKIAKNAVSVSAGYDFKDAGIFISADAVSAISSEYLENGETKKYEKDGTSLIPFLAMVNASYKVAEDITLGAKAKISCMIGDNDSTKTELYPNVTYKLQNKMGSLTTGVRMDFDKDGLSKFAIPLNWKCTLADIKK